MSDTNTTKTKEIVDQAQAYAQRAVRQFASRAELTDIQRELLQAMFALAWQSGYGEGGKTMAAMIQREWDATLKRVDQR